MTTKYTKGKRLGLKVVNKVFFKDGTLVFLSISITLETLGIKYHGKKLFGRLILWFEIIIGFFMGFLGYCFPVVYGVVKRMGKKLLKG